MVYSSSSIKGYVSFNDSMYYFKRQLAFFAIGLVITILLAAIPYKLWGHLAISTGVWLISVFLLLLIIFMGIEALGAERTISIGPISFQPAESAKAALIMLVSAVFAAYREERISLGIFCLVIVAVAVTLGLVYKQPDLGTSLIMVFGILSLAVLAGFPWKVIGGIVGIALVFVIVVCIAQPYHLTRIITMLNPYNDPAGDGFQTIHSFYAFGSGGFFGSGLGMSRQKYLYLPEAHTDFIFAIIGEEGGFIACMTVVVLFGAFIWAGIKIAHHASDIFGCLLAGGLTSVIGFQACVNMLCVLGFAPITGKPLPFISYGGTSLICTLGMVGLILSVSFRSNIDAQYERRRNDLLVIKNKRNHVEDDQDNFSDSSRNMRLVKGGSQKPSLGKSSSATRLANRNHGTQEHRPQNYQHFGHARHNEGQSASPYGHISEDSNNSYSLQRRLKNNRQSNRETDMSHGRLNYQDALRRKSSKDNSEHHKPR